MHRLFTSAAVTAAASVGAAVIAVATPGTAQAANPIDAAVAALKSSSVYVGAKAPTIDRAKLGGTTLSGIKVAIVPTGGPSPVAVAERIGARLDPSGRGANGVTVLAFEGHSYGAASTARCGVGSLIEQAVATNRSTLQSTDDVTSTVADFAAAVQRAPSAANGCNGSAGNRSTAATSGATFGNDATSTGSSHTGLWIFLGFLALAAAAVVAFLSRRRRKKQRELDDARAQVQPFLDRLAADVQTINPGGNATARQAMADANERLGTATKQLAAANSIETFGAARRTAIEGLYASRTARTALGLDPGAPLPPPLAGQGAQLLDAPQQVTVQGQSFQGYPAYAPGAPYFFGGGYGVPGGWYGVPFWETLLIGSALGGGLGLGFGGFGGFGGGWGGYGAGYETGYDSGYNAGEIAADRNDGNGGSGTGGGDTWGDSGGGGSWGDTGGGGWGDSGSSGDSGWSGGDSGGWGDSGGDMGGGDFGGGDFGGGGGDSGGGSW